MCRTHDRRSSPDSGYSSMRSASRCCHVRANRSRVAARSLSGACSIALAVWSAHRSAASRRRCPPRPNKCAIPLRADSQASVAAALTKADPPAAAIDVSQSTPASPLTVFHVNGHYGLPYIPGSRGGAGDHAEVRRAHSVIRGSLPGARAGSRRRRTPISASLVRKGHCVSVMGGAAGCGALTSS